MLERVCAEGGALIGETGSSAMRAMLLVAAGFFFFSGEGLWDYRRPIFCG